MTGQDEPNVVGGSSAGVLDERDGRRRGVERSVGETAGPALRASLAERLYDTALSTAAGPGVVLQARYRGRTATLPVHRWLADADAVDRAALCRWSRLLPRGADVLDLGCGPGRHTAELHRRDVRALGVDASAVAVHLAQRRGAPALRADALGPLPGAHHGWDGVLLLDGNVGIGGDPVLLLCRVRDLLRPTGRVLVELDPQGTTDQGPARLRLGTTTSAPFPWARLGAGALSDAASWADLVVQERWSCGGRLFAVLRPAYE